MSAKMKDNSGGAFKLFFVSSEPFQLWLQHQHSVQRWKWLNWHNTKTFTDDDDVKKKRITSSKACFFCLWKKIIRVVFYAYDNYKRNKILFVIRKLLKKCFQSRLKSASDKCLQFRFVTIARKEVGKQGNSCCSKNATQIWNQFLRSSSREKRVVREKIHEWVGVNCGHAT